MPLYQRKRGTRELDSENKKKFDEIKQKINWELNTKDTEYLIFIDEYISSCTGTVNDLLNGLAKLTMHLYNQGVDKRDIKRAVKYGLSLGRTEEE